jgi:hypothetical protein
MSDSLSDWIQLDSSDYFKEDSVCIESLSDSDSNPIKSIGSSHDPPSSFEDSDIKEPAQVLSRSTTFVEEEEDKPSANCWCKEPEETTTPSESAETFFTSDLDSESADSIPEKSMIQQWIHFIVYDVSIQAYSKFLSAARAFKSLKKWKKISCGVFAGVVCIVAIYRNG